MYFRDNIDEPPQLRTESPATENVINRLKSIAHLKMSDTQISNRDSITREEMEALKNLLDRNLQKYQNYYEHSIKRRPNDPYIGQILQNMNGEEPNLISGGDNNNKIVEQQSVKQMPIRRKIIRHTIFATPPLDGGSINGLGIAGNSNIRRFYSDDSRIDWSSPWADYFPILIKDPFQTMMNSFSEIIEYGPAADICRHIEMSHDSRSEVHPNDDDGDRNTRTIDDDKTVSIRPDALKRSRRNTAGTSKDEENIKGVLNHVRPFRPHTTITTTSTEQPKLYHHWAPDKQATEHNGDTGPQIKRLVVRRGGVAIAGPGGIATAGSGGTAIVGPGGSAYSSKDSASGATADVPPMTHGISMAGYGPQMVQVPQGYFAAYPQHHNGFGRSSNGNSGNGGTAVLSSDGVTYSFPVPSRGLTAANDDSAKPYASSTAREIRLPDGAKLIATGPIVYYNPEPSSRSSVVSVPIMRKRSHKGKKSSSNYRQNTKKERRQENEQLF